MNANEFVDILLGDQPDYHELARRIADRLEALPEGSPYRRRILEIIGLGRARQLGYYEADVIWLSNEQLEKLMHGGKTPAELDELCLMLENLIKPENH